jgi:predicted Zn-dependent protease
MIHRLTAFCLIVALALPAAAQPEAEQELVLLRVPPPALDGLEPAVREQLQEGAARLTRLPDDSDGAAARAELAERFGELGHLYHAYELWPSAEAAYENARRLEPAEISWTWSLAVVAFRRGELAKARDYFTAVLALEPEQPGAMLYLAEIALQEGQANQAAELAVKVLTKVTASPAALSAFARSALLAEQPKDAIPALELALEQVPEANRLHYLLAMAKRSTGDLEGAKQHMALAGQVGVKIPDPLDAVLAGHRRGERVATVEGDLAMKAGRFAEAVDAYQRAATVQPKNPELLTRLGGARATAGDYAGAEKDLRRALELDPFQPVALMHLGRLLAFQGKHAEAVPFLERLLDLDTGNLAVNRELGLSLNALGRRQQALERLRPVAKAQPGDEEAVLAAAVAAVELGLFREGRDLLEASLLVDPGQGRLVRALARLLAAAPQLDLRDGPRAVELAEGLVRTTGLPQDQQILALAYAEAGRCKDAADLLDKIEGQEARARAWRKGPPCRP